MTPEASGTPPRPAHDAKPPDLLHQVTMADVLAQHAAHTVQPACVCGEDRYSYAEFDDRTNRLANALSEVGVRHGDRILWLAQNCHRLLESLLAAAKLGAVMCPVNWRQSADELAFVIEDCSPAVVIWQQNEIGESLAKAHQMAESSTAYWVQHDGDGGGGDGASGYEAMLAAADPAPRAGIPVSEPDAVLMLYTAAFAGRPAGALLSHRALVTQGALLGSLQGIGADYVYLNCGPLFHVATLMTTLATFVAGGTNVFTPRVDAEELCRLIESERCTGAFIMPPTINQIVELNSEGQYDLHTLRTFAGKRAVDGDDHP